MTPLCVNARFLTRPMTGVDRVAAEMTRALGALCAESGRPIAALAPAGEIDPDRIAPVPVRQVGPFRGHLWEQAVLPAAAGDAILLNFCNAGPLFRRRQVVVLHDAQVYTHPASYSAAFRAAYRLALPALARRADLAVTVSRHSRDALERHGVAPPGKLAVIPNGADHVARIVPDPAVLDRAGIAPGAYILAVGSGQPHKNIAFLERAADRAGIDLPLVIVGGAGPRSIGRVSDGALKALYENARAFAFPSLTEGFGLPALEAMACGCPVIASSAGALPEVCGDAALLLPPTDDAAWSTALRTIAADDALCERLAQAGRHRAAGFTWSGAARQLLERIAVMDGVPRHA